MKNFKFLLMLVALTGAMVTWQGCDDDGDNEPEPTCTDGIQNGDETGIDCGGTCDPCEVGIQGEWQSSGANVHRCWSTSLAQTAFTRSSAPT